MTQEQQGLQLQFPESQNMTQLTYLWTWDLACRFCHLKVGEEAYEHLTSQSNHSNHFTSPSSLSRSEHKHLELVETPLGTVSPTRLADTKVTWSRSPALRIRNGNSNGAKHLCSGIIKHFTILFSST